SSSECQNRTTSLRLLADFRPALPAGMVRLNGGHHDTHLERTRYEFALGLGDRRRCPPDAAGARVLERLSPAPVGHRRLSGTLVRRLPRPQAIDRRWPLPPSRRKYPFLARPCDPGLGDDVDL